MHTHPKLTMEFKRSLTLGEAITTGILLLGIVIGFYVNVQVRLQALELRVETFEQVTNRMDASFDKVNGKLDGIKDELGTMKVAIASKQDKK